MLRKEGGDKVEDYREITLMSSAYKIYTMILAERLREEMERRVSISQNRGSGKEWGQLTMCIL